MKYLQQYLWALLLVAMTGCVTRTAVIPFTGDLMVDAARMITNGPPQDRVLWQDRLAAEAMRRGQFAYARQTLDDALLTTGGISTDKSAKLARSYFHPESTKTFIGEPYERVMTYYYRGILYWMDGQADNARACFRSGAIQDMDAENHSYAADYVQLDYLDGFASLKLNEDGSDAFERSQKEARQAKPPAYDPNANVLFFLEFGPGPYKYAAGEYRQELHFGVSPSPVQSAEIHVDGHTVRAEPYDDLYFQATTRGGRVMDHILANKAVFKGSTDVAGNVAIIGGAIAALQRNRTSQEVGLGLIAAGVVSKIVSASTTAQADARDWDNLPRYLSFAALELPPGPHTATIQFQNASGGEVPKFTKQFNFTVPATGEKVLFVSDQSITPQNL